jgi:hypothetical protein
VSHFNVLIGPNNNNIIVQSVYGIYVQIIITSCTNNYYIISHYGTLCTEHNYMQMLLAHKASHVYCKLCINDDMIPFVHHIIIVLPLSFMCSIISRLISLVYCARICCYCIA